MSRSWKSTAVSQHFVFYTWISHTSCSLQRHGRYERRLKAPTSGNYTSTCLVSSAVSAFLSLDIITPYPATGPSEVMSALIHFADFRTKYPLSRNTWIIEITRRFFLDKKKSETILRRTWTIHRKDWKSLPPLSSARISLFGIVSTSIGCPEWNIGKLAKLWKNIRKNKEILYYWHFL